MSVRVGQRREGNLQVLRLTRELAKYTLSICKNEKAFPKSYRWLLTQRIVNEAVDSLGCVKRANSIRNIDTVADYNYRFQQQKEAHAHIEALLSYMDLAYEVIKIDDKRMEYWTGLAVDADNKIQSWTQAFKRDHKKYSEQLDTNYDSFEYISIPEVNGCSGTELLDAYS